MPPVLTTSKARRASRAGSRTAMFALHDTRGQAPSRSPKPGKRLLRRRFHDELVVCNATIRSYTTGRGTVDPPPRLRRIVVLADITHEFPLQIGHRGEHAAGDDIALDLGEPELDLVEPGRIGRGVMQMHVRMPDQEILDTLGLVCREVVADDVNLFAAGLVSDDVGEEGHELGTGVPRRGLAQDLTGLGIESGVERERPVA